MNKFLENNTLSLRAPEPEDLEVLYKWENDTDIWQYGTAISPYSKFILKQYIADAQTDIFQSKQ
ncbi:MAG: GNAT family N-acetyltransferase, partial [Dysgonamonadaceae bacterium]|nr:GNAT family N-acetyltransferase [Dysgonamonadaceae bacterium]